MPARRKLPRPPAPRFGSMAGLSTPSRETLARSPRHPTIGRQGNKGPATGVIGSAPLVARSTIPITARIETDVRSTSPEQFGPLSLPVIPEPDITRFESELTACPDCGLAQRIRRPQQNQIATCVRCGAVLEAPGSVGLTAPLALAITGIFLAAVANLSPLLTVRLAGAVRPSRLITGPLALGHEGLGSLGLLVAALSILIPLVWLGSVSYVLASLQFDRKSPSLAQRFRLAERLRPLAMVDVFLLGSFVAFTRLRDLATVDIGPGGWALAALAVTMVAVDTT